jgi:hypothetical protein
MTNSTGLHHLALVPSSSGEPDASLARAEPRLGLPTLDQLALTSFVTGDAAQLVEHARSMAEALAGTDGDAVRQRTVARALAITRCQLDLIDAALGQALGQRDLEAVKVLTKLADSMTRRLRILLDEHRIELGRDRPVQMFVAHADTVKVGGR